MTDVRDFTPVFVETLPRVRARMDGDANAGLQPDDPLWVDTREGSFYWDLTQVCALECARLWDAIGSETVAAAFPSVAWGDYLDEHAVTFGLVRNPAIAATGNELFVGTANTVIPQGTQVSAPPSDPSFDTITFQTTQDGTIGAALQPPSGLASATASGTLPAGTHYWYVTAYNELGESRATPVPVSATTSGARLTWSAEAGADGYRIYRASAAGVSGLQVGDVTFPTFTDDGSAVPGALMPLADAPGSVLIPVTAKDPGTEGNLPIGAVSNLDTVIQEIVQVTNQEPTSGGVDPEDDDSLQARILAQYQGSGAGTVGWYQQQGLNFAGVGRATCVPVWQGAGTVLLIPSLEDGSPVASTVVDGLQQQLDPVPGLGHGTAPIGHTVTVKTTTPVNVTINGVLTMETGYSLDGLSGTTPTRAVITQAVTDYLASVDPGSTITYQQLMAVILGAPGVIEMSGFTLNGGTSDLDLTLSPPQYPNLLALNLS